MKTHHALVGSLVWALASAALLSAQPVDPSPRGSERFAPVPRFKKRPLAERPASGVSLGRGVDVVFPEEYRTITGVDNGSRHPDWGSVDIEQLRITRPAYADGSGSPAGPDRPSARAVSNAVAAQYVSAPNSRGASDYLWAWGQFLDHDLDETPLIDPAEPFNIPVPTGDPYFDPYGTGTQVISFNRSFYNIVKNVRQQVNAITSYLDASNVYGSDEVRAYALRTLDGTGRLKTSEGDLLPFNTSGLPNAPSAGIPTLFLAGDVRANENSVLMCLHTILVREHNYWAESIAEANPGLADEEIYQMARAIVGAEMQAITYREFLPVLLGPNALAPYRGYRQQVNPGIANEFSTVAYRVGHTMLSPVLRRLDASGNTIAAGDLELKDAFFNTGALLEDGVEPLLRGLASQPCQEIDNQVIDAVRNFLFGPPGAGGFDLVSLNVQRGRDHGLPGYNKFRAGYRLPPARTFQQINPDPAIWQRLATVYDSPESVDPWVGGLCEPHAPGAMVGPTFRAVLKDQFERLRDGDRFWYQIYLPPSLVKLVEEQTLAAIIRRNTGIRSEIQGNVFLVKKS